jgi:hypothetical protein
MARSPSIRLALATLATTAALQAAPVLAGEIYVQAGLPGYGLGYAHPLGSALTLRADYVTLGSRHKDTTQEGILYSGDLQAKRLAAFADWYPFAGVFRLSAGYTSNKYKLTLDASGAGRTINVGGTNYTLGAGDGLLVEVKYPNSMPYLGLGWGHQQGSGLRFSLDLGAGIGKPTVTATGRGQLAAQVAQADIDRELVELRDGVGKIKVLPQLSFAIGYSF